MEHLVADGGQFTMSASSGPRQSPRTPVTYGTSIDRDAVEHQPALAGVIQLSHLVISGHDLFGQGVEDSLHLVRPDEDVQIDVDGRPRLAGTPQQRERCPEGIGNVSMWAAISERLRSAYSCHCPTQRHMATVPVGGKLP
jgi:hypothetical protein